MKKEAWCPGFMHRCEECMRPLCQLRLNNGMYNGTVLGAPLNEYGMYGNGGNA